jgi:hypothetical protein
MIFEQSRLGRASAVALVIAVASCAALRPSPDPLGVGPLPPNYRREVHRAPRTTDRRAATTTTPPTPPHEATADGGVKVATKIPEAPGPSSPGSKDKTAPVATKAVEPSLFVGDYTGEDVSTYRLGGMPEREDKDPKARITVKASGALALDIVLVDSSNGKDICTLKATLGATNATIAAGQKCFEQTGSDASATATIRTGTVTIEDRRLVVDLELDFEMHLPDQDAKGTLAYHFDGTRR